MAYTPHNPPRRALITGATGFTGSHLVEHLRSEGWAVQIVARPDSIIPAQLAKPHVPVHPYRGDTADLVTALERSRPDVVFHLACMVVVDHRSEQVEPLIQANVLFGTQLLEAMAIAGVKSLVNAGTSWQYFHSETLRAANLYAATKQAFEAILAYYVDAFGMRATSLTLFDSYGPGDTRPKVLRLLCDCFRTGERLEMSPGDQVLDLVHVRDLCRAFLRAAQLLDNAERSTLTRYAVSGGERMSLRETVATLERAAGRPLNITLGARPYRKREVMQPCDGPSLPGWSPRISLAEGFQELIETLATTEMR